MSISRTKPRSALLCALAAGSLLALGGPLSPPAAADTGPLHDVLLIGNAVSGTVSFLDGHTFQNLGSFNNVTLTLVVL